MVSPATEDERWMRVALAQAREAECAGEVPVGAVLVKDGVRLGVGSNAPCARHDPTAHAEILALRAAAQRLGNYRLDGCALYVTLEPCAMCAAALLHARVARVVFAATDPKTGAAGSVLDLFADPRLNHQTQVTGGVLRAEGAALLQRFFQARRTQQRAVAEPLREDALRTPAERFATWPEPPGWARDISDLPALAGLRLHWQDAGLENASVAWLMLHGGAGWSLQWRSLLQAFAALDQRALAVDLIGFGRSDKPKKKALHTVAWHARVVGELLERLGLGQVVLVAPEEGWIAAFAQALAPRCVAWLAVQPEPLPDEALQAPFPDHGHRAGPRALARVQPHPGADGAAPRVGVAALGLAPGFVLRRPADAQLLARRAVEYFGPH